MTKRFTLVQRNTLCMKAIDQLKNRLEPLSVKEAARIYGDSVGEFYRKIRRGEIPGAFRERGKPKGRIKICTPTFIAWVEEQIAGGINGVPAAERGKTVSNANATETGCSCGKTGKPLNSQLAG